MALALTASPGRCLTVAVLAAASLASFCEASFAAPAWLRKAIQAERGERQAAPPPVARYQIDEGGGFVLERNARGVLLKFDDSQEVWALSASRAPRGDIIYKNDIGEPFLRATKLGGMTVFTPHRPSGSAAALSGASTPLRLAPLGPLGLYQRMFQASVRCSRAAQHGVGFEALDASPASDGLMADTVLMTVIAMLEVAGRPDGKAALARVAKIELVTRAHPGAELHSGVLTLAVAPSQGIAGRPSSERIARALEGRAVNP